MAKYTTLLGTIVESGYDLGLQSYPIFDENYRETLNKKILDHYEMREIGFETAALFKKYLNRRMNEIMPLYNQRYLSTQIEGNLYMNMQGKDVVTTIGNVEGTAKTTNKNVYQDTPMSELSDLTDYATNITEDDNNVTNSTDTEQTVTHVSESLNGLLLSEAQMLVRQSFLNVDMEVINELENLFMQIW